MIEIEVNDKNENQRLDKLLLKYFNNSSKSFIYKMIRKKNIKYNNQKAIGNELVKSGDIIQVYLSDSTLQSLKKEQVIEKVEKTFDIIYEDENILICNKPAGLLTQRNTKTDHNTLIDQVIYYLSNCDYKPAICNRLDRNTSGIVLVGKNLNTIQILNKAIHDNKVKKLYKTIVLGNLTKPDIIKSYYNKDEIQNKAVIFDDHKEDSKPIITKYTPLKSNGKYTLLEIELVTGKSHQIRAHLSSISCPIIGDTKYGNQTINTFFKQRYNLNYQILHAYKFKFEAKGSKLDYLCDKTFEAPLPSIFKTIESDLF